MFKISVLVHTGNHWTLLRVTPEGALNLKDQGCVAEGAHENEVVSLCQTNVHSSAALGVSSSQQHRLQYIQSDINALQQMFILDLYNVKTDSVKLPNFRINRAGKQWTCKKQYYYSYSEKY